MAPLLIFLGFWVYSITHNKWTCVFQNGIQAQNGEGNSSFSEIARDMSRVHHTNNSSSSIRNRITIDDEVDIDDIWNQNQHSSASSSSVSNDSPEAAVEEALLLPPADGTNMNSLQRGSSSSSSSASTASAPSISAAIPMPSPFTSSPYAMSTSSNASVESRSTVTQRTRNEPIPRYAHQLVFDSRNNV